MGWIVIRGEDQEQGLLSVMKDTRAVTKRRICSMPVPMGTTFSAAAIGTGWGVMVLNYIQTRYCRNFFQSGW